MSPWSRADVSDDTSLRSTTEPIERGTPHPLCSAVSRQLPGRILQHLWVAEASALQTTLDLLGSITARRRLGEALRTAWIENVGASIASTAADGGKHTATVYLGGECCSGITREERHQNQTESWCLGGSPATRADQVLDGHNTPLVFTLRVHPRVETVEA
ncbi:hypothetical protein BJX63DRAFT_429793 [Aspergillus granulosus]|uniref:Uncharacterized protein n=1 Tax=Aspergillus granulosus TaxID=176169 RepID=A0ABR4HPI3_9EURO